MGMDLYGLNPHNPKKLVRPTIDWSKEHSEEDKDIFFKSLDYYEKNVPGYYFRNNCWWWRPLWDYTYNFTNILSEEEYTGGHHNDGQRINSKKAEKLSFALHKLIDSGHTKQYEDDYMKEHRKAEVFNDIVDEKLKMLNEKVRDEIGSDENWLAPADFPQPYRKEWEDLFATKKIQGSYPFSVENVREFANFCYQSGGFEIC